MKKLLAAAAFLVGSATASLADWAPDGPLNLWIGFGPGGETDTLGRAIAAEIEAQTDWEVVAENKPGGGGIAMFTQIAIAPADGQIIGLGVNMPVLVNLVVRGDKLPFDLDSFDYLATVASAKLALVAGADQPFSDFESMVEYSKANGGIDVAFDAKPQELILKKINAETGAGLRMVSAQSTAEMMQLLLGGQVQAAFGGGQHIQYLESGQAKVIASAGRDRLTYAPDVKSLTEQGVNASVDAAFYVAAPAGLDPEAKDALAKALDGAINSENVANIVRNMLVTEPSNPGPDGTKDMLVNGMDSVKVLFGN